MKNEGAGIRKASKTEAKEISQMEKEVNTLGMIRLNQEHAEWVNRSAAMIGISEDSLVNRFVRIMLRNNEMEGIDSYFQRIVTGTMYANKLQAIGAARRLQAAAKCGTVTVHWMAGNRSRSMEVFPTIDDATSALEISKSRLLDAKVDLDAAERSDAGSVPRMHTNFVLALDRVDSFRNQLKALVKKGAVK